MRVEVLRLTEDITELTVPVACTLKEVQVHLYESAAVTSWCAIAPSANIRQNWMAIVRTIGAGAVSFDFGFGSGLNLAAGQKIFLAGGVTTGTIDIVLFVDVNL